jgi:hypothetical protein
VFWGEVLYPSLLICGVFGLFFLLAVVSSYLALTWFNKRATQCPACDRKGAGEVVESRVLNSVTHTEQRTRWGLFRQDRYMVQVTDETYEDHFECQHCGHRWIKTGQWTKIAPRGDDSSTPDEQLEE